MNHKPIDIFYYFYTVNNCSFRVLIQDNIKIETVKITYEKVKDSLIADCLNVGYVLRYIIEKDKDFFIEERNAIIFIENIDLYRCYIGTLVKPQINKYIQRVCEYSRRFQIQIKPFGVNNENYQRLKML